MKTQAMIDEEEYHMRIIKQGSGELFTDPDPDHARRFFQKKTRKKDWSTIYGQCILMHAEPVRSYHLLHRWWAMSVHSQYTMVRLHCKGES
jgi:hypothetical protein